MIRVYLNADGTAHRVLSLDATAAADLPPVDIAHGETTVDLDRALPDTAVERWDVATRAFVTIVAPAPRLGLTLRAWRKRFDLTEQVKFRLLLNGVAVDGATALTPLQLAQIQTLNDLLHDGSTVDPTDTRTLEACDILVQFGVVTQDRVAALVAPVAAGEEAVPL